MESTRCYKGGATPKLPPPPSPTTAAENAAKSRILQRQRKARGYAASILTGAAPADDNMPQTLKTLLGS